MSTHILDRIHKFYYNLRGIPHSLSEPQLIDPPETDTVELYFLYPRKNGMGTYSFKLSHSDIPQQYTKSEKDIKIIKDGDDYMYYVEFTRTCHCCNGFTSSLNLDVGYHKRTPSADLLQTTNQTYTIHICVDCLLEMEVAVQDLLFAEKPEHILSNSI